MLKKIQDQTVDFEKPNLLILTSGIISWFRCLYQLNLVIVETQLFRQHVEMNF